jgi:PHD/YefM family antitoxin component YafN of YafNO toxin-antitoxin module
MPELHPQYITDTAGNSLVILSQQEFNAIMEELEELEDIRMYDEAKKHDNGERIPMEEAFAMIEAKRKNS